MCINSGFNSLLILARISQAKHSTNERLFRTARSWKHKIFQSRIVAFVSRREYCRSGWLEIGSFWTCRMRCQSSRICVSFLPSPLTYCTFWVVSGLVWLRSRNILATLYSETILLIFFHQKFYSFTVVFGSRQLGLRNWLIR